MDLYEEPSADVPPPYTRRYVARRVTWSRFPDLNHGLPNEELCWNDDYEEDDPPSD
jgi:hypothetical protein